MLSSARALARGSSGHLALPLIRSGLRVGRRFPQIRRAASTVTQLENYPSVGDSIHGFVVQQKKHVPELHLTAVHLKHDKTGADYLHVARDDKNNVFSIGFKTNPPDATGLPHILEHTTLCGSEKCVFLFLFSPAKHLLRAS